MAKQEVTAVAVREKFAALMDPERLQQLQRVVSVNYPNGFTLGDLPVVKCPAGGGKAWELPSGEVEKTFSAIIVAFNERVRRYYDPADESQGRPPDCQSTDGLVGVNSNGGATCADCPHGQWGSGKGGRGKACKDGIRLLLMPPSRGERGVPLPWVLTLPPTSIRGWKEFKKLVTMCGRTVYDIVTVFGLEQDKNPENVEYSYVTLHLAPDGELDDGDLRNAEAYRRAVASHGEAERIETQVEPFDGIE